MAAMFVLRVAKTLRTLLCAAAAKAESCYASQHVSLSCVDGMQDYVLATDAPSNAEGSSYQGHAGHTGHRQQLRFARQSFSLPRACMLGLADAGPQVWNS